MNDNPNLIPSNYKEGEKIPGMSVQKFPAELFFSKIQQRIESVNLYHDHENTAEASGVEQLRAPLWERSNPLEGLQPHSKSITWAQEPHANLSRATARINYCTPTKRLRPANTHPFEVFPEGSSEHRSTILFYSPQRKLLTPKGFPECTD